MATTSDGRSSSVIFRGRSGTGYRFQAWPLDTEFKGSAGVYIVTKRECLDRTFPLIGSHRCLAIGQTANFAASLLTKAELSKLSAQGANCICVYPVAEEVRRLEIERDLIEGNEQWRPDLHYLFRAEVPERAPGPTGKP
jgi:hypothetical protein